MTTITYDSKIIIRQPMKFIDVRLQLVEYSLVAVLGVVLYKVYR